MKPTKEQIQDAINTPEGAALKETLEKSPILMEAEQKMSECINVLARSMADYINVGFQVMISSQTEQPSPEELENMKFRMVHMTVDDIPSQLGLAVADCVFPDGWTKVAARQLLNDLMRMVESKQDDMVEEVVQPTTSTVLH